MRYSVWTSWSSFWRQQQKCWSEIGSTECTMHSHGGWRFWNAREKLPSKLANGQLWWIAGRGKVISNQCSIAFCFPNQRFSFLRSGFGAPLRPFPNGNHGLCPKFYNSAFKYYYPAVKKNKICGQTIDVRDASDWPHDGSFRMGYFQKIDAKAANLNEKNFYCNTTRDPPYTPFIDPIN